VTAWPKYLSPHEALKHLDWAAFLEAHHEIECLARVAQAAVEKKKPNAKARPGVSDAPPLALPSCFAHAPSLCTFQDLLPGPCSPLHQDTGEDLLLVKRMSPSQTI
jgi:hypothetical protein